MLHQSPRIIAYTPFKQAVLNLHIPLYYMFGEDKCSAVAIHHFIPVWEIRAAFVAAHGVLRSGNYHLMYYSLRITT